MRKPALIQGAEKPLIIRAPTSEMSELDTFSTAPRGCILV
jgi:hypothetical protein